MTIDHIITKKFNSKLVEFTLFPENRTFTAKLIQNEQKPEMISYISGIPKKVIQHPAALSKWLDQCYIQRITPINGESWSLSLSLKLQGGASPSQVNPAINDAYLAQQLLGDYRSLVQEIRTFSSRKPSCYISYCWEVSSLEEGLQKRVIGLTEELERVGIKVDCDLKWDNKTNFQEAVERGITDSNFVLLIGSPSYPIQAEKRNALTGIEAPFITKKRTEDPTSVIPQLMVGEFSSSFPPGYNQTIGAPMLTALDEMRWLPSLIARLYGVSEDFQIKIETYQKKIEAKVELVEDIDNNRIEEALERKERYLASKQLLFLSRLSEEQKELLDGKIEKKRRVVAASINTFFEQDQKLLTPIEDALANYHPLLCSLGSLEDEVENFLKDPSLKSLLIEGNTGLFPSYLVRKSWVNFLRDDRMPLVIDLDKIDNPKENLIIKALEKKGISKEEALILQERLTFLFIIVGFDVIQGEHNYYALNKLNEWKAKVIFTCREDYIKHCPYPDIYFSASDAKGKMVNGSFQRLKVTGEDIEKSPLITPLFLHNLNLKKTAPLLKPQSTALLPIRGNASVPNEKPKSEKGIGDERAKLELQNILFRPHLEEILGEYRALKEIAFGKEATPIFISYAWPSNREECTQLQKQLRTLVKDLKIVGFDAMIDVERLKQGDNLESYMKLGIEKAEYILFVGHPRLKERCDGKSNLYFEYKTFVDRGKKVVPVLYKGGVEESYPDDFKLVEFIDFRAEEQYFHILPQLVERLIEKTLQIKQDYNTKLAQAEKDLSPENIALFKTKMEQTLLEEEAIERRQIEEARKRLALASSIERFRDRSELYRENGLIAQEMMRYIPIKAGRTPNPIPETSFDLLQKVLEDLQKPALIFIQGPAGGGKSLFARSLERFFWENNGNVVPVFISLRDCQDPNRNIVEETLQSNGLSIEEINEIRENQKVLILLDGLDEISLEHFKQENLITNNHLFHNWKTVGVLLYCRTEQINAINENSTVKDLMNYLKKGLGKVPFRHYYLTYFDKKQIQSYLQKYFDGRKDWQKPWKLIQRTQGLIALVETPFILRMVAQSFPVLQKMREGNYDLIPRTDIYEAFRIQWGKEAAFEVLSQKGLKPTYDQLEAYFNYGKQRAAEMYFTEKDRLQAASLELQRGLPLKSTSGSEVDFLHKSIKEHLLACYLVDLIRKQRPTQMHYQSFKGSPDLDLPLDARALNERYLVDEFGTLYFLSEILTEEDFKRLFELVYLSRSSAVAICSANAITMLNWAHVSFSFANFSRVKIPRADLSHAIMDSVDFSHADLQGVRLNKVWMNNADFTHANLTDISFGEDPPLTHHTGFVHTLALSQDGKLLVSGGSDKTVQVLDLEKEEVVYSFSHDSTIKDLIVHNDQIIAGDSKGNIVIWNRVSRELEHSFAAHSESVTKIELLSNEQIATCSEKKCVKVWNLRTQTCLFSISGAGSTFVHAPDEKLIYVAGPKGIVLWNIEKQEKVHSFKAQQKKITALALGQGFLFTGAEDGKIAFWDLENHKCLDIIEDHTEEITDLKISPDGFTLISASKDRAIILWDIETRRSISVLEGHRNGVESVVMSPDGRLVYSASLDKSIQVWNIDKLSRIPVDSHKAQISSLVRSSDGKFVLTASRDGTVRLWDMHRGKTKRIFEGDGTPLLSLALAEDDRFCYAGDQNGSLWQWEVRTGELIRGSRMHSAAVSDLVVTKDEGISASLDGSCKVWDLSSCEVEQSISTYYPVHAVKYCPVQGRGYALTRKGIGEFFWTRYRSEIKYLFDDEHVWETAFDANNDGSLFFVATIYQKIFKLLTATSDDGILFGEPKGKISTITLLSNEKILISTDLNGGVVVWDVTENPQMLCSLQLPANEPIHKHITNQSEEAVEIVVGSGRTALRLFQLMKTEDRHQTLRAMWGGQNTISAENLLIKNTKINNSASKYIQIKGSLEETKCQTFFPFYSDPKIVEAARNGDSARIILLLEKGCEVNERTTGGQTALMFASEEGHKDIVEMLLKNGGDLKAANNEGVTALMLACKKGHKEVVDVILNKGVDIHLSNKEGLTALLYASQNGNKEIMLALLEKGGDPNYSDASGCNALILASKNGHKDVVEVLVNVSEDLNKTNNSGWTALMFASQEGHREVVELLLSREADPKIASKGGKTAISEAAWKGKKEIVRMHLSKGVDPETATSNGTTLLMIAAESGYEDVVELFLREGVNINLANNKGYTALMAASQGGQKSVVKQLLHEGARVNLPAKKGETALSMAAEWGYKEIVEILLNADAEVNVYDHRDRSPLAKAAIKGHKEIVEILLRNGAVLYRDSQKRGAEWRWALKLGYTMYVELLTNEGVDTHDLSREDVDALISSSGYGHKEVINFLLKAGVSPNITDVTGKTMLMSASEKGRAEVVEVLLKAGANPQLKDDEGSTALELAYTLCRQKGVVEVLLNYGADPLVEDNKGGDILLWASLNGYNDIVVSLLQKGVDLSAANDEGSTALPLASQYGHKDLVDLLLNEGMDPNASDKEGETALMSASQNGHVDVVVILLNAGADPIARDNDGWTALMFACSRGHKEIVEVLLEIGADPNVVNREGKSILMLASYGGNKSTVQLLLNEGVDPKAVSNEGVNALMCASKNGHKDVVEFFLREGVDPKVVNNEGVNALMFASKEGYKDVVEILLREGVDPKVVNNEGVNAIMFASKEGHKDVVEVLLREGIDPKAAKNEGETALMLATEEGHQDLVEMLLKKGVDPNAATNEGVTTLMLAIRRGRVNIVELLLNEGVDPNAVNKEGVTALMLASQRGFGGMMKRLLSKGADPKVANKERVTALMFASRGCYKDAVELLLDGGANPNSKTQEGKTALMFAVGRWEESEKKSKLVVEALIKAGANPKEADNRGQTAQMIASESGYTEIPELLRQAEIHFQTNTNHGKPKPDDIQKVENVPVSEKKHMVENDETLKGRAKTTKKAPQKKRKCTLL